MKRKMNANAEGEKITDFNFQIIIEPKIYVTCLLSCNSHR